MNSAAQSTAAIHLQHVGLCNAKPAAELTIGDRTVWNGGYTYTVVSVIDASRCFVNIEMTSDRTGETWTKRAKKTRLVGVSG